MNLYYSDIIVYFLCICKKNIIRLFAVFRWLLYFCILAVCICVFVGSLQISGVWYNLLQFY